MSGAGKPLQSFIIPDKLISGRSNIESVSSQLGQVPGVVTGDTTNLGRAFPVQSGTLTDEATDHNYLVKKAGDALSGEWVYKKSSDTEYYGGSDPRRFWGFHTPNAAIPGSDNCAQAYSYIHQKIVTIGIQDPDTVYVKYLLDDTGRFNWTSGPGFTLTNPIASGDCHAQLNVLDDGRLMLIVRTENTALSPTIDYDVYHSIDGGDTFTLVSERIIYNFTLDNTFGTQDTDNQFRVAVSGDYIRLCFATGAGVLNTWLSRDRGLTWQRSTSNPGAGDFSLGTTGDPDDPYPFDLTSVDDSGTFIICVIDPAGSTATQNAIASIDGQWSALLAVSGVSHPAIVRSIIMVRTNNYIWQFTFYLDETIPDSGWKFRRVLPSQYSNWTPSFPALVGWQENTNPISQNNATVPSHSCDNMPGRVGAVWTKDKIFFRGALRRVPAGTDRTWAHCWFLGGWDTRSVPKSHPAVRLDQLQGPQEYARFWNQLVGNPGAAAGSFWTQATAGSGAVNNSVQRIRFRTSAINDEAEASMLTAVTNNWGEGGNRGCVWGFTVKVTAGSGDINGPLLSSGDYMACRINATTTAGGGGLYQTAVRLSDTAIKLVGHGPTPTEDTISGLDLTVFNEIRVSMQQNPTTLALEQQVAVFNTETKVWTVGNTITRPFQAAVASELINFGMISPVPVAGPWECQFLDFWLIQDIPDIVNIIDRANPGDLFGEVMSSSAMQTEDGMLVSWSGAGAAIGDSFTGLVNYSYPAESTLTDCPRVQWRSNPTRLTDQLIINHNQFNTVNWTNPGVAVTVITPNVVTNPYGVALTADNINITVGFGVQTTFLKHAATTTEGAGYTVSFWAKRNPGTIDGFPISVSASGGSVSETVNLTSSWKFFELSCVAGSGVSGIEINIMPFAGSPYDISFYDFRASAQPFVVYDANPTNPAANQLRKFVHDASAVFGTNVRRWIVDYSDVADFTSSVSGETYLDALLFETETTPLSVRSIDGNTIGFSAPSDIIRGSLLGKYIRFVSGLSTETDSYTTWKVIDHEMPNDIVVESYQPAGNPEVQGVAVDDQFIVFDSKSASSYDTTGPFRYCRLRAVDEQVAGLGPTVTGSPFQLGTSVIGRQVQIDVPLDWSFTDSEQSNVTTYRTRGAVTWGYNEGPPQRVITARLVGDVERYRDVIRYFQRYLEYETRALAIILDNEAVDSAQDTRNGPANWLLLGRIVSGNEQDNAAWYFDSDGVLRVAGDLSLTFNEEV